MQMSKRKTISKKVRFEVFKRDGFKCQYCGKSTPDAVLQIDHITPVAKGGDNHFLNLITACDGCNNGKGAQLLDDKTALTKTREQMAELEEKRQQLAMMAEWRKELIASKQADVECFVGIWNQLTGYTINDYGFSKLRKWAREFSFDEIADAMEGAVMSYAKRKTPTEVNHAFDMIGAVAKCQRIQRDHPEEKQFRYIRGILNNRFGAINVPTDLLDQLRAAFKVGVPMEDFIKKAKCAEDVNEFTDYIEFRTDESEWEASQK
jgi:hypothetical protein